MKVIAKNKKAFYDYEILEKFHAGIVLKGQEVKAIKQGKISLAGAFILPKGEEFFLVGAQVAPYQSKNAPRDYNPQRDRKLLLKKSEIKRLLGQSRQKGLTMVPLMVYIERNKIKIEFALTKPKRKYDKREKLKKRAVEREIERKLKER